MLFEANRNMTATSSEQQLIDILRSLSDTQRQQLLNFAQSLHGEVQGQKVQSQQHSQSQLRGALSHYDIQLTEEDFSTARKEMWSQFSRRLEK